MLIVTLLAEPRVIPALSHPQSQYAATTAPLEEKKDKHGTDRCAVQSTCGEWSTTDLTATGFAHHGTRSSNLNAEAPEILISSKEGQTSNMSGVLPAVSLSACCTQAGPGAGTLGHQDVRREQTGPATGARSSRPGPWRADPAQARRLNA